MTTAAALANEILEYRMARERAVRDAMWEAYFQQQDVIGAVTQAAIRYDKQHDGQVVVLEQQVERLTNGLLLALGALQRARGKKLAALASVRIEEALRRVLAANGKALPAPTMRQLPKPKGKGKR